MRRLINILIACWCLAGAVSCDTDLEREVCDYTVQLRYDYNEENGTTENRIEYYVSRIDEYIFDEAGILFAARTFTPDRCTEFMHSELTLPPGRYSVIAIGNRDTRSAVTADGSQPRVGVTRREDMRLNLDNAEPKVGGTVGDSEPLYHGYKTFTVTSPGISRIRVDMINAHLNIKFRVTWKGGRTPARGDYYALLESVPGEYALMPEWIFPIGSFDAEAHDCDSHDGYPTDCNNVIHHIPHTCHGTAAALTHRHDTYINVDGNLWGEFTTYRIKEGTAPLLKIFSTMTRSAEPLATIDLEKYLDWWYYDDENYTLQPGEVHALDHDLKQAYEIDIAIDGDRIILSPLDVADYEEGGQIH